MADNTSGLPVQTISGQFVATKLVDTGGTNVASVSSGGALKVDASGTTMVANTTQWGGATLGAAVTPSDAATLVLSPKVAAQLEGYNGSTEDLLRTTTATDGHAANTLTGVLLAGIGPGFARRFTPSNLATASSSAVTQDVNGAGTVAIEIGTTTTGTFVVEVSVDGTTWQAPLALYELSAAAYITGNIVPTLGHIYVASVNGMQQVRLRTTATLGATVANVWTLSIGDAINLVPGGGSAGAVNLTQIGGASLAIGQTTMAASLPVTIASNQSAVPVSGTVTTTPPANASTNLTQVAGSAIALGQTTMSASLPVTLASNQSAVPVSGSFWQATQPVSGTFWQATQPVSGTVAVSGSVAVTGTFWQTTQPVSGTVAVTGTFWQTTQPVSGTITTTPPANASTNIAQVGGNNTISAGTNGALAIGGTAASGATKTGNPVGIGAVYTTAQPAVTTGQIGDLQMTAHGALFVAVGTDGFAVTTTPPSNASTNITQVAGAAIGATAFLPTRITDGTSYYAKTGQTAGTAAYAQLSDQTNTVSVIATTNALKTDASSIAGAVPSATNAMPVRLTNGAAFYTVASAAPNTPHFLAATSASLGAGANTTLNYYVTSGKTGTLSGFDIASTIPLKIEIQTKVTGTPTSRVILFCAPYVGLQWRAPWPSYLSQASSDGTTGFSLKITNLDASVAADVYGTGYWDEN